MQEGNENKMKAARLERTKYVMPKFEKALNEWLKIEDTIRASEKYSGSNRARQCAKRQSVGLCSDMEKIISTRIRYMHKGDIVIEARITKEDTKFRIHGMMTCALSHSLTH